MNCKFCAEQIQEAAILCRFCGATKRGGEWTAPAGPRPARARPQAAVSHPASFIMRSTGGLLIASALFEMSSITSAVPLFGEMREGALAVCHHGLLVTVFAVMGIGLWQAAPWGATAVYGGTGLYVVNKLVYLLDTAARNAEITAQTAGASEVFEFISRGQLLDATTWSTLAIIASWLGFAGYVYVRRSYFDAEPNAA